MRMAMLGLGDRPAREEFIEVDVQTQYGEMRVGLYTRARVVFHRGQYHLQLFDEIPLGPDVDEPVARVIEERLEGCQKIRVDKLIPKKEAA